MSGYGVASIAASQPDRLALVDGKRRLTYGELHEQACRLAHTFAEAGAGDGDTVAVMMPNRAEYVVAALAAAYAQTAFLPINCHLKAAEVGWILADSQARVLVAAASLADQLGPALAQAPACRPIVVGPREDPAAVDVPALGVAGAIGYTAGLDAAGPEPIAGAWTTPQWMFYTSGTTGRPKGVVHAGMNAEAMERAQAGLMALWGITGDDVYLLAGPAYHAGPGGYTFTTLHAGGTVVVQPEWNPAEWFRLVERHGVTLTFLTPAHFIRLLEVPRAEAGSTASLRLVIQGGAPCPVEVKRAFLDLVAPAEVSELYGASEGGITRITAAEWRERPGSVGTPWPGVEVAILDEAGHQQPAGTDGPIYVRPAGGARFRYHNDDAKTADAWREDRFTVGDIGHLDDDGYLYVTDRAGDMVLWGGVNVYPREIEEVLHAHPAVVDCAVVGVPDERYGEVLAAVVEVRDNSLGEADLATHVRAALADFKCPARWAFVADLPRTSTGKVPKRALRDWLAAGTQGSPFE
jgi:long-chain acyl-CoA synthetase